MAQNRNKHSLAVNLNRLAVITLVLVSLKVFTFFFQSFLPVFSDVFKQLAAALLPFILALLLAFLLEPVVQRITAFTKIRRSYASLLSLLLVYGILGLLLFAVINRLHTELNNLAVSFPSYDQIVAYLSGQIQKVQYLINLNPSVKDAVFNSTQDMFAHLKTWASATSVFLLKVLAALPGTLAVFLIAIIGTYFISADFPRVKVFLHSIFPRRWKGGVRTVSTDLGAAVAGFLKAELTLIGITMVLTTVGLFLLGLDYAFTIGVLTGLLDLMPVVGTGLLFLPWIFWNLIIGQVGFGIKLAVVWGIIVAVRQVLEPKLLSKNIGLDPLPTLISMYVGARLLGGWGLILGPALVIIYHALARAGVFKGPRE